MKLKFITTNKGKAEWAQKQLAKFGIETEQVSMDLFETRDFEVEKVARSKALYAQEHIQELFIVEDSGFCVQALNNFPGTQVKLLLGTFGIKGLLKLMSGIKNRSCLFQSCLVYSDKDKNIKSFIFEEKGTLSKAAKGTNLHNWSALLTVWTPEGSKKTAAEFNDSELEDYQKNPDNFIKLGEWLSQKKR